MILLNFCHLLTRAHLYQVRTFTSSWIKKNRILARYTRQPYPYMIHFEVLWCCSTANAN